MKFESSKDYKEFIDYLFSIQDTKYKAFHEKLLKDDTQKVIGIQLPKLRSIAKEIVGEYKGFIKYNNHEYVEETMLHGLIISYLNRPIEEIFDLLDEFLPDNNNWAINDSVSSTLKIFTKNLNKGYYQVLKYLKSSNPWTVRFGLTLLLDYYITDIYIDRVVLAIKSIKLENYYVRMANAWLISSCYIKYPNKIIDLYKENVLDSWTTNKSISKIRDSYRVVQKDKDNLLQYKKEV